MKKREILYFYGALILLAILISVAGLLYRNGYRLQGFHLGKAGNLEVAVYEAGSKIFIDNKLQKITETEEEIIQFNNITQGKHTVAVTKEGYVPWEKEIEVTQFSTEKVSSFLSPVSIALTKITDPKDMEQILYLFEHPKEKMGPTTRRLMGKTALWADSTSVYMQWMADLNTIPRYFCSSSGVCSVDSIAVFHSGTPIVNVDFYKTRENIFLVAHGETIDAIEIGDTGQARSYSLYKGSAPTFYKISENTFYIKDGKNIFRADI
ncbi:MAG: PEGA domain-containing protein [Candidatus Pacebacteria bacterium]|nr:PEGA domain-containing protein [Candidatus Paceibacterota bacterium]